MSSQSALALSTPPSSQTAMAPTLDLCERIYLRNYALHQAAQESINNDWGKLLRS